MFMQIYSQDIAHSEDEKKVLNAINEERKKQNLQPLSLLDDLTKTTNLVINQLKNIKNTKNIKNDDVIQYIKEQNIDSNLKLCNIKYYKSLFQNLAVREGSAADIVNSWINNNDKKKIINNPDITHFALSKANFNNATYWYSLFISIPKVDNEKLGIYRQEVINLVNQERAKNNLKPLAKLNKLEEAAIIRAKEQHEKEGHVRPNNTSCFTVIKDVDFKLDKTYMLGENVASGQFTPEEVVKNWMNSESHRKNILNPDFNYIGVGNSCIDNKIHWVQIFYKGKNAQNIT